MTDIHSGFDLSKLPPRSAVGTLDAEVAGEGMKIVVGGEEITWTPPPEQLAIPDWSKVKPIRHYFGKRAYKAFPAWFYHPTEKPRLVATAEQARKELGVFTRKATNDEILRYGIRGDVWDWEEGSLWRSQPVGVSKIDPHASPNSKNVVPLAPNPQVAQHALVEAIVPQVAAAVAQALKGSGGPVAPANVEKADWDEFLEFKAWKKAQEVVEKAAADVAGANDDAGNEDAESVGNALQLTPEQELEVWRGSAEAKGIKVDKRWGIDRLKQEIEKVEKAA